MNLYKLYPKYSSSCSPTWISEASRSMEYLTVDELLEKKMINDSTCEFDEMDDVSMKKKMMMAVASTNLTATAADDLMNEEKEESS